MMDVQPQHAMKNKTTTWCGLVVNTAGDVSVLEQAPVFIAPNKAEVTCIDCKHANPEPHTRSQQIVSDRLQAEAERFAKRHGAPPPEPEPGIDPLEVAAKVKQGGS